VLLKLTVKGATLKVSLGVNDACIVDCPIVTGMVSFLHELLTIREYTPEEDITTLSVFDIVFPIELIQL
jgi:hypothetical protein